MDVSDLFRIGCNQTSGDFPLHPDPTPGMRTRLSPQSSNIAIAQSARSPSLTVETRSVHTADASGEEDDQDDIVVQHLLASLDDFEDSSYSLLFSD